MSNLDVIELVKAFILLGAILGFTIFIIYGYYKEVLGRRLRKPDNFRGFFESKIRPVYQQLGFSITNPKFDTNPTSVGFEINYANTLFGIHYFARLEKHWNPFSRRTDSTDLSHHEYSIIEVKVDNYMVRHMTITNQIKQWIKWKSPIEIAGNEKNEVKVEAKYASPEEKKKNEDFAKAIISQNIIEKCKKITSIIEFTPKGISITFNKFCLDSTEIRTCLDVLAQLKRNTEETDHATRSL